MRIFPPRVLIPEPFRPEGVTADQFETRVEEGAKEGLLSPQEDVSGTRPVTVFVRD